MRKIAPLTKKTVETICVKKMPVVETCVPESGEYTSPIVAPRWLSMKLPTFSATQNGIDAKKPMRNPMIASLKARSPNIQTFGSPGGIPPLMNGIARHENPSTAALLATPGIIDSVSAGQTANAPPILAIASTAARIHLWNST